MALFSRIPIDKSRIEQAIITLEQQSSAELRVYVERHMPKNVNVFDRTFEVFEQLEMDQTVARNGVLIYVAFKDHACCVLGDEGIHAHVGDIFWQEVHEIMIKNFKHEAYTDGIVKAIECIGRELAQYFPRQEDDVDELPNEVIINE
ncbi:TPM domain-containing protein [Conservatibacter flavescens]|uniref:TPM domain-containing protein n=1 Tax=Conservatibacter flavescens TaxID=28161 RepID=A0A2M8S594_9PAST|nr:TPM domain-containing protein [Conservatibacter flavescens]PJG86268.1 hypothetical protein CVP05_00160 [Conservatibacter flavescens]